MNKITVALAADHAGFALKEELRSEDSDLLNLGDPTGPNEEQTTSSSQKFDPLEEFFDPRGSVDIRHR